VLKICFCPEGLATETGFDAWYNGFEISTCTLDAKKKKHPDAFKHVPERF